MNNFYMWHPIVCQWHEWVKPMLATTQVSLLDKESVREQHVSIWLGLFQALNLKKSEQGNIII